MNHLPNYAKTVCVECGEHWPCAAFQVARDAAAQDPPIKDRTQPHPFRYWSHCASCAVGQPWRV